MQWMGIGPLSSTSTERYQKRSLPSSYLLSMPVRIRELLPKLASVSLSCGEKRRENVHVRGHIKLVL